MENLSRAACFSLFFCLFFALTQSASCQSIVINEIAWMGNKTSSNDEWIELYNNTNSQINLSGWKLISQDNTPEINLSGKVPAFGFYLLERTDDNTVPEVAADQIYTGALGNSGENLTLYDNTGNLVEKIDCSQSWSSGNNQTKQTMERIDTAYPGNVSSNWKDSQNPGGTPKAKNSAALGMTQTPQESTQPKSEGEQFPTEIEKPVNQPQPASYPSGITINEILPSPTGPDETEEWIEIFNQNQFEVDLSSWQIKDSVGTLTTFTIPSGTKIPASGYLIFRRPDTKIVLNNDGDAVSLIQPNGNVVETISYPKAPLGQSWSRTGSDWLWSSQLTPGAKNIIPESASQSNNTAISEAAAEQQEVLSSKKWLSSAAEQVTKNNFIIPLIALAAAVFFAIIILILKRNITKV